MSMYDVIKATTATGLEGWVKCWIALWFRDPAVESSILHSACLTEAGPSNQQGPFKLYRFYAYFYCKITFYYFPELFIVPIV